MPKMNADEGAFEPIEVIINGKTYSVKEVNQNMFEKLQETVNKPEEERKVHIVYEQLGVLLSVDGEEFNGTDLRKAGAALKFLQNTITAQIEGKTGNA